MKATLLRYKVWILLIAGALVVLLFYFYNASSTVTVQFDVAPSTDMAQVGDSVDLNISINNNSGDILRNADLQFTLPDGLILENGSKVKLQRIPLGEINPNAIHTEDIKVIVVPTAGNYANAGQSRDVAFSLGYSIGKLSAKFKQVKTAHLAVADVSLNLDAQAPQSVVSGEAFDTVITYDYEGTDTLNGLKLQVDYPDSFKRISAKPDTGILDNVWSLGSLNHGAKGRVTLTGSTILPNDSTLTMAVKAIINILGRDYVEETKYINVAISPAPLSLKISTGEDKPEGSAVYKPGDVVNYTLSYTNNTDIPLSNIALSAKLTGAMFDLPTLKVSGARFDPQSATISWDQTLSSALTSILPNTTGSVSFSIGVLKDYPIKKINDRNFILKVDGKISSPTVPEGLNAQSLTDIASSQNKVVGLINVSALALFRDANSLILNAGSLPPRVGTATDFTIHWQISNFSTDVKNVTVRAKLPTGVTFTGTAKSTLGTIPMIDTASGDVIWQIDRIAATTGVLGDKPEAIFQVKAKPAAADLGNYMSLLSETNISAVDDFTGADLTSSSPALTTRLEADPSVHEGDGKVVQ